MDNYHEEQTLGKAYDSRLARRLLRYAKPYWALIALCVLLLLMIAVTDLARPYLVKVAIDDHILGSNVSYVQTDGTGDGLITIQGYTLERVKGAEDGSGLRFKLV